MNKSRSLSYTFKFRPPKDGSILNYYFKTYRKSDVYGYSAQTFNTYVNPDTSRLSKLQLVPSSNDTMMLAAKSQIQISLQGYAGSTFSPKTIPEAAVRWKLVNAPNGTRFIDSTGAQIIIATGSDSSATPVRLQASIDTTLQRVGPLLAPDPEAALYFNVSSKPLTGVTVNRIDAGNPLPVATSALSQAEFIATGQDAHNNVVTISPQWSISPVQAGAISLRASSSLRFLLPDSSGFLRRQTGSRENITPADRTTRNSDWRLRIFSLPAAVPTR